MRPCQGSCCAGRGGSPPSMEASDMLLPDLWLDVPGSRPKGGRCRCPCGGPCGPYCGWAYCGEPGGGIGRLPYGEGGGGDRDAGAEDTVSGIGQEQTEAWIAHLDTLCRCLSSGVPAHVGLVGGLEMRRMDATGGERRAEGVGGLQQRWQDRSAGDGGLESKERESAKKKSPK